MKKNLIAYVLVIIMIGLVFLILINRNPKEIEKPILSSFQQDSIALEERFKIMLAESEKKFQEQMQLQESYQKGYEAGLNALQREDSYFRGYEKAKSIFKEDADYYRNELEKFIEDAEKKSSVNNYANPVNEDSLVGGHMSIADVSDFYSRSMPSSEYDTIHYSDYINNLEKRKIFFGFTSDLSVGLTDGNPAEITSWNYLGVNYQFGEEENISLHFGYSKKGYRLMCSADWLKKPNYTFYATEKVTWGGENNGMALSLGVERKWTNSPFSVYSELGGCISNKLHPYCEVGLRLNFQKKIWEF